MLKKLKPCKVYNEVLKGPSDYQQIWRYQKILTEHAGKQRKSGQAVADSLLIVQHQSLYTLGRGATLQNLKFKPDLGNLKFFNVTPLPNVYKD